jgi:heat shock protein HtpX
MAVTFRDLIAANKRNSALLVTLFILFTAVVVMVLGLAIVAYVNPSAVNRLNWKQALLFGGVAAVVSGLYALISYYAGANIILGVSRAREIEHKDDPQLFNVVEEMAIAAGVPMPKVYLIDDSAPNAFATGRDPEHGIVAITTGLRDKLNREELQGVIAHEMAHIRNYDIRLMMLMAVLIGLIVMMADLFWQMIRYSTWSGGHSRRSRRDKDGGGGAVVVVLIVVAIILAIIAPILAQIIQLAVSRQREYLADATGVQLTRNPLGLAGALRKSDGDPDVLEVANRGTAHLYIANPIKKFEARASSMFASHPPIQDRIARLEALAHQ